MIGKVYKCGGELFRVRSLVEWRGNSALLCEVVRATGTSIETVPMARIEGMIHAQQSEWREALLEADAADERRRAEAVFVDDAQRYGVAVRRFSGRFGRVECSPDTIVRCTKTRWVGVKGRYVRDVRNGGRQVAEGIYTTTIHQTDLQTLRALANGQLRLNFMSRQGYKGPMLR